MFKPNAPSLAMIGLLVAACASIPQPSPDRGSPVSEGGGVTYRALSEAEARVILHKGTELPYSGEYYDHWEEGTFVCKQCNAPLYRSTDKFDAACGWPSFDDEIKGAVTRTPDADGIRTEITCTQCGGHLGHVFLGERFTDKNLRHCVNSISLLFVPAGQAIPAGGAKRETAYLAGGCFWGVEYLLKELDGVHSVRSGYMGGATPRPTYPQVITGRTGHAETVEVVFDPSQVSFETVVRLFFEIHDPTQLNRQGPDIGTQYRSAVFYADPQQKATTEQLIGILREVGYDVVTEVTPADTFWPAEDFHQNYYARTGDRPYCHSYVKRFP